MRQVRARQIQRLARLQMCTNVSRRQKPCRASPRSGADSYSSVGMPERHRFSDGHPCCKIADGPRSSDRPVRFLDRNNRHPAHRKHSAAIDTDGLARSCRPIGREAKKHSRAGDVRRIAHVTQWARLHRPRAFSGLSSLSSNLANRAHPTGGPHRRIDHTRG